MRASETTRGPRRYHPGPRAAAASGLGTKAATRAPRSRSAGKPSSPSSPLGGALDLLLRPRPRPPRGSASAAPAATAAAGAPRALSSRAREAVDLLLRCPPPIRIEFEQVSALLEVFDGNENDENDGNAAATPSAALEELFSAARQSRDSSSQNFSSSPILLPHSRLCTFSPKAFLPVTRLCSDECGYCSFASHSGPPPNRRAFMSLEEVLETAAVAASVGATEALFTLGDRPEVRWPEAKAELRTLSELHGQEFASTPAYVSFLCSQILKSNSSPGILLPHSNAGLTTPEETRLLRTTTVSQGLMLETTATGERLKMAHNPQASPGKNPNLRLAWLAEAGRARVPTTSGLLVGIGETRRERLETLLALRDIHCGGERSSGGAGGESENFSAGGGGGHLQEIIVQPFQPKKGTRMGDLDRPPPSASELLWTVAVARLVMGPAVGVQSPPNLSPVLPWLSARKKKSSFSSPSSLASPSSSFARDERDAIASWRVLLRAGADDFGGVSPLTPDYVSPEAAWPHLDALSEAAAMENMVLAPRLAVYPGFLSEEWLSGGKQKPKSSNSSASSSSNSSNSSSSLSPSTNLTSSPLAAARRLSDAAGLSKGGSWRPGGGSGGGWLPPLRGGRESRLVVGEEGEEKDEKEEEERVPLPLSPSSSSSSSPAPSTSSTSSSSQLLLSSLLPSPAPRHAPRCGVEVSHRGTLLLGGGGGGGGGKRRRRKSSRREGGEEEEEEEEEAAAAAAAAAAATVPAAASPALLELFDSLLESYREEAKARRAGKEEQGEWKPPHRRRRYLSETEAAKLFEARGADFDAVVSAADELRSLLVGEEVTFVVNRNINYTNVCSLSCAFCAFSASAVGRGESEKEQTQKVSSSSSSSSSSRFRRIGTELFPSPPGASAETPYLLSLSEVEGIAQQVWASGGATEVCLQGGIHPSFGGDIYPNLVKAALKGAPAIHVHAFSPLEVTQGALAAGKSVREYLKELKEAGLGSLPGTAAENLRPKPRNVLCPEKISGRQWLGVMRDAHAVGLKATATIMFGAAEGYGDWARHLRAVRALQLRTIEEDKRKSNYLSSISSSSSSPSSSSSLGVFTEFVPLPFVPDRSPGAAAGVLRTGPTRREAVLLHSVARLFFADTMVNVQASWPKLGKEAVPYLLNAGCNDTGGVLMKESITRAAGGGHGQGVDSREMRALVSRANDVVRFGSFTRNSTRNSRGVGERVAVQRTTLYGRASAERVAAADRAAEEREEREETRKEAASRAA